MNAFKFYILVLCVLTSLASVNVQAKDLNLCLSPALENTPTFAEGRVTPLSAYAKRIRNQLFSSSICPKLSATALYCYLSQGARQELETQYSCKVLLKIDHFKIQELLSLTTQERFATPSLVASMQESLLKQYHSQVEQGEKTSDYAIALTNLLNRHQKLTEIEGGQDWKILGNDSQWSALKDIQLTNDVVLSSLQRLSEVDKRSMAIESFYETLRPFELAIFICLFAFALALLSKSRPKAKKAAIASIFALIAIEVLGMALRILVANRAPVTNMYETVMIVGIGSLLLGTLLGFKLRDPRIWMVALFANVTCLFMMRFATGMLDKTIEPLVPVLRDNFWLSTHVTSVTLSYACFTLSWFISNYVILRWIFTPKLGLTTETEIQSWNQVIRICMQIGCVFLAAGVILGGVWADYSWGRFWGWDPKETWSLIALMVYILILHGRYAGWFQGILFTIVGAAGYFSVLMTWFGVNYILAVGLHSYGFSSGGTAFLVTLFTSQVLFLSVALWTYFRRSMRKSPV